jgi:hypothetical protein
VALSRRFRSSGHAQRAGAAALEFIEPMPHLIMYSTNTRLAFMLNEKYYAQQHHVYCCPYFDPQRVSDLHHVTPPSSSPSELFGDFASEAFRTDRHGARIAM